MDPRNTPGETPRTESIRISELLYFFSQTVAFGQSSAQIKIPFDGIRGARDAHARLCGGDGMLYIGISSKRKSKFSTGYKTEIKLSRKFDLSNYIQ